jgi:hypothetical protein
LYLKDFRVSEMGFHTNPTEQPPSFALRTLRTSVGIWHDFGINDHAKTANTLSNAPESEDLYLTAVPIGVGAASVIFDSLSAHTTL